MMATLLAPGARWVSAAPDVAACACPPDSCTCESHHHGSGHHQACAMATGGKCAVESPDAWMKILASNPVYVGAEQNLNSPLNPSPFAAPASSLDQLPGHRKPSVPPPRASA